MAQDTKEVYGVQVPAYWDNITIESLALQRRHPVEKGGLGHHGHLRNLMMLLWPHKYAGLNEQGVPRWNDYAEMITWAWCENEIISIFGHAAACKSHTLGHIIVCEYLVDIPSTAAVITSTHLQGLKNRIFCYVFEAVSEIRHRMPLRMKRNPIPTVYDEQIGQDKFVIQGIATNKTDEATQKIQGIHADRVIICVDEAAGTPQAIFDAAANLQVGTKFFRQVMLMNPDDLTSHAATWAEPPEGFKSIQHDNLPFWKTRRGGISVHFSWDRNPNKIAGRTIYPYLLNEKDIDNIIKRYGEDSPQYYTFALGWFPPAGLQGYVFNQAILEKAVRNRIFNFPPVRIAALDPAFEGGDISALAIGEFDPDTFELQLRDIIQIKVDVSSGEPMDWLTAKAVTTICTQESVQPRNLIVDTTGGGRGVYNFLAREWSDEVQSCGFGQAATTRKFKPADRVPANEMVDRFVSELWWAARAFVEEGLVGGIDPISQRDMREELMSRRYVMVRDRLISVEMKVNMKKRTGKSPDHADAFCLLIELMRRKGAVAALGGSIATRRPAATARSLYDTQVESWGQHSKEPAYALPFDP